MHEYLGFSAAVQRAPLAPSPPAAPVPLLPTLQALPRADKLQAIQFLTAELAKEDDAFPLKESATYPIWSPFDCYGAAAVMQRCLEEEREKT